MFVALWTPAVFSSEGDASAARLRLWMLRLLHDGLKTKADSAVLSRSHVLSVLMSTLSSVEAVDLQLRHAALDIFFKAVCLAF
jgi:hypothetical protein